MDSTQETTKHIERVQELLGVISDKLVERGYNHDYSKLHNPEKVGFDEMTHKLSSTTYGSDEYKQMLKDLKPILDHHYENNSHHPEHYKNGIDDMDLLDVVEMLMDWKASTERHEDGDIHSSLKINKMRFNMSDQLYNILNNTIKNLKW
jgi:hypothetical protein